MTESDGDGGGNDIARKFDDDWSNILANIRQIKSLMPTDPENAKAQVAHYGEVQQQIVKFMKWASQKLPDEQFYPRLVIYGDQLTSLNEFTAATLFCYDPCIKGLKSPPAQLLPAKVSSIYGRALGAFSIARNRDSNIEFPQTLNQALTTLGEIQEGMQMIFKRDTSDQEDLAYLILNGTVHLYSICEPLMNLGFCEHAVEFVTWSVLSMEAIVNLSTTRHLPWRNKLYTAICHCYEDMASQKAKIAATSKSKKTRKKAAIQKKLYFKTAQVVVEKAKAKLKELIEEEMEDPPLPKGFEEMTSKIEDDYNILLFKYKAIADPEQITELLAELFGDSGELKLRALLEAIVDPTRGTLDRQAPGDEASQLFVDQITKSVFKVLAPFSEVVGLPPPSEEEEEEAPPTDDEDAPAPVSAEDTDADEWLPLPLHLALLKEFFGLAQWGTAEKLLKWAELRVGEHRDGGACALLPAQTLTVLENECRILRAVYDLEVGPPPPVEEDKNEEGEGEEADAADEEAAAEDNVTDEEEEEEEEEAEPIPDPLEDKVDIAGKQVPILYLRALSESLRLCTKGANRIMCAQRRDLITAAALELGAKCTNLVGTADALKYSALIDDKLAAIAVDSLTSVHVVLAAVDYDDPLLRCKCGMQLALLLEKTQDDLRMAVQMLRHSLEGLQEVRARQVSYALHKPAHPADRTALTRMAFVTEVDDATEAMARSRPSGGYSADVGAQVFGAGSKLDPFNQALAAAHVDLVSTLLRIELALGLKVQGMYVSHRQARADAKRKAHEKAMAAMTGDDKKKKLKAASTTVDVNAAKRKAAEEEAARKASDSEPQQSIAAQSAPAESRLMSDCKGNCYWRALLQTHMASLRDAGSHEQELLLRSAMAELTKAKASEDALVAKATEDTTASAPPRSKLPPAPTIASRAPTSVTLRPNLFVPASGKPVKFFRAYGKPAGAGTAVSMNNTEYPGTNTDAPAVYDEATGAYCTAEPLTVSGLLPNEVFVFAVAAFDASGKVIGGIGTTSLPVEAVCPLPLLLCWGYVSKRAIELGHKSAAQEAGMELYSYFVRSEGSRKLWAANPMLAHCLRRERVARSSKPLLQTFVHVLRDVLVDEPSTAGAKSVVMVAHQDEPSILVPKQVQSLLSVRKMVMATEVAAAIEEAALLLDAVCKAHRLMVPLLRLKRRGPHLLQALGTLHQAMQLVPLERWDAAAKQVFACVSYEMALAGRELREDDAVQYALMAAGGKGLLPKPEPTAADDEDAAAAADEETAPPVAEDEDAVDPQIAWGWVRGAAPGAGTTEEQEALEEFLYTLPMYERIEREGAGGEEEEEEEEAANGDGFGAVKLSEASAINPSHERPSTANCLAVLEAAKARKGGSDAAVDAEDGEEGEEEPEIEPGQLESIVPAMWQKLNQAPEEAFSQLQESYRAHPRYLEYACKALRYCLARGGKDAVGELLEQVELPSEDALSLKTQAAMMQLGPVTKTHGGGDMDDSVLPVGTSVEVWCRARPLPDGKGLPVYGKEYNQCEWYEEDRDGNPLVQVQFQFYSGVIRSCARVASSTASSDATELTYHVAFDDGWEVESVPQYRIKIADTDSFLGSGARDQSVGFEGKGEGNNGPGFGHEFLEEGEAHDEGANVEADASASALETGAVTVEGDAAATVTFDAEATTASGGTMTLAGSTAAAPPPSVEELIESELQHTARAADTNAPQWLARRELLWLAEYYSLKGLVPLEKLAGTDTFEQVEGEGPGLDLTWELDTMDLDMGDIQANEEESGLGADFSEPELDEMGSVLRDYTKAVVLSRWAHAWGLLQNACAQLWNGITARWASPKHFARSTDGGMLAWKPLLACCTCLLDMVEILQKQAGVEVKNTWNSHTADADDEESDDDDDGEEHGAPNHSLLDPVQEAGVDTVWMARFTAFTIQVLCNVHVWPELVTLGRRFNALTGNCYAEPTMAILLFAQRQRVGGARARLGDVQSRLETLDENFQKYLVKKKKKKTRLVVVDVETKEEKNFKRQTKRLNSELDHRSFQLQQYEEQLSSLVETNDALARAKSLSLEALDESRLLLQKYVRMRANIASGAEEASSYSPRDLRKLGELVVASYSRTVGILRQKRAKALLAQALIDLGNYHSSNIGDAYYNDDDDDEGSADGLTGSRKHAVKAWADAVDAVFNKLDACSDWRGVLAEVEAQDEVLQSQKNGDGALVAAGTAGESGDALLRHLGLWPCILAGLALTKIGQHGRFRDLHQRVEQCRFASRMYAASFSCSLPHPSRLCDFLRYKCVELWPGVDLFGDKRRCSPDALLASLRFCGETLLGAGDAQEAVVIGVACEHVASHKCLSLRETVAARLLRLESLVQLGDLSEACASLGRLLAGADLPDAMFPPSSTVKTGLHGVRSDGEFSAKFFDPSQAFHNNTTPGAEVNAALLGWLQDHAETQLPGPLSDAYGEELAHRLVLARARLLARFTESGPSASVVMGEEAAAAVAEDDEYGQKELAKREAFAAEVSTHEALSDAVETFAIQLENMGRKILGEPEVKEPADGEEEAADEEEEEEEEEVEEPSGARLAIALKSACECLLLRASLRLQRGLFITAREHVREAQTLFHKHGARIAAQAAEGGSESEESSVQALPLSLWLRCRVLLAQCDLGQGRSKEAMQQVSMGLREAAAGNETVYSRQLRLEAVKVLLCVGRLDEAEGGCRSLLHESRAQCREDRAYCSALLLLASARRERALTTSDSAEAAGHLRACRRVLVVVEKALELLLASGGWVGPTHSPESELSNWYLPHTVELGRAKALLGRARVEEALAVAAAGGSGNVASGAGTGAEVAEETEETEEQGSDLDLRDMTIATLDSGLATLDHTVHPLPNLRPAMLLLRGRMGREQLAVADAVKSGYENEMDAKVEEVVQVLKQAMVLSVEQGGHDRGVLHSACMELAALYSMQLVPGAEARHASAARHYLSAAYAVQQMSRQLETGLQEMGAEEFSEEALASLPAQAREELLSAGAPEQPAAEKLTALCVLHYFVALERERGVWPSTAQGDLTTTNLVALHRFLLENLEPYREKCCCTLQGEAEERPLLLASPLPEPVEGGQDGAVCVQWWQGRRVDEATTQRSTVDFMCVLGGERMVQLRVPAAEVRRLHHKAAALRHALERKAQITEQNAAETKAFKTFDEQSDEQLKARCKSLLRFMARVLARAMGGGGDGDRDCGGATEVQSEGEGSSDEENPTPAQEAAAKLECTLELAETLTHMLDVRAGVSATNKDLCAWLYIALEK